MLTPPTADTRAGFSMIEIMVATAMTFMIITYVMGTFTIQHQNYMVVDQVSEIQQNTVAIASLIERDARSAGYLVSVSGATCGIDNTGAPDVLYLSDAEVILPPDELGASLASQTLGSEVVGITGGSTNVIQVDDLVIDGAADFDTNSNGTADSDFHVGGGVILVDVANPELGVLCGTITAISTGTPLTISAKLTATSWTGTPTNPTDRRAIPAHVYEITNTNPPTLTRNGVMLAKDVEDLQAAWFLDADGDNQVDANEYKGDDSMNTYGPLDQDGAELREIRINLVLRTRADDPRNPSSISRGQQTENRSTGVVGADGRRRRVHTVTVRLRNLSG